MANPNIRAAQPAYNAEIQTYPTYRISTLPVQEVQLRSGRTLLQQGKSKSTVVIEEELEKEEVPIQNLEKEQPTKNKINITTPIILDPTSKPHQVKEGHNKNIQDPPFPKRLMEERPTIPENDLEVQLRNLGVKIPLLQAIKDIPILANTIKELSLKKPGQKRKQPTKVQVVGQLAELISNKPRLTKYENPGNPIVTSYIKQIPVPNTLVDQGASINIMTVTTMEGLQLGNLRPTPITLELADRSKVKPIGVLDDVIVTLTSLEFPVDFMVIQPKLMEGHPMILSRPWLATVDAYIGCRNGEMIISNGLSTKKVTLHQPTKPVVYNPLWFEDPYEIQDNDQPLIDVNQTREIQEKIEEHILD